MNDKELAEWLEKIWKTGFIIAKLNENENKTAKELCPNFYDRLKEE